MFLQPQLKTLMRDGSEGAERHDARNLQKSWRRFAAFAYVAEQYGYRYDGLSPTSPKGSPTRTSPSGAPRMPWSAPPEPPPSSRRPSRAANSRACAPAGAASGRGPRCNVQ